MSILTAWSPFFHSTARMHGRSQFSGDRVERIEPIEDELIRAYVQEAAPEGEDASESGAEPERHLVTVRRDDRRAEAECTCSQFEKGTYCKHIWATLLDVQHNEGPGASAAELAKLRVRAPKARKRTGAGRRPIRQAEPQWMGRLSLLRPPMHDQSSNTQIAMPAQRQICYVVLPEASERSHGLVVELQQRTPTATGWSKAKPFKIDAPTIAGLADPVDRELCALLLGGAASERQWSGMPASMRGEARYRLPSGAWRTLLQRMIATQRCFVAATDDDITGNGGSGGNGNDHPLAWAGQRTWTLWLVGHEARGRDELLVNVELRRDLNEPPLAIEKPAMVLGGLDGVVIWNDQAAPLDDRDALSWMSHFRDEYRRHDQAQPIRVPKADVERFLDRLYLLPQLPEIDLPEGIGRVPQHVEPVPHLDLFSPGSQEAAQLLPASAKNQLLAKIWFAYDGQRVSPAQVGRFVAISSIASMNTGEAEEAARETGEATETDEAAEAQTVTASAGHEASNGSGNGSQIEIAAQTFDASTSSADAAGEDQEDQEDQAIDSDSDADADADADEGVDEEASEQTGDEAANEFDAPRPRVCSSSETIASNATPWRNWRTSACARWPVPGPIRWRCRASRWPKPSPASWHRAGRSRPTANSSAMPARRA